MKALRNRFAMPIVDRVRVLGHEELPDGQICITVPCPNYQALTELPPMLEFNDKRFGRTGWNSDRMIAYYKTGARNYAKAVTP